MERFNNVLLEEVKLYKTDSSLCFVIYLNFVIIYKFKPVVTQMSIHNFLGKRKIFQTTSCINCSIFICFEYTQNINISLLSLYLFSINIIKERSHLVSVYKCVIRVARKVKVLGVAIFHYLSFWFILVLLIIEINQLISIYI